VRVNQNGVEWLTKRPTELPILGRIA